MKVQVSNKELQYAELPDDKKYLKGQFVSFSTVTQ